MSAADPPDKELSSHDEVSFLVLAAEGILSKGILGEFSSLSQCSGEGGLQASAEGVLVEGVRLCCRFAERVDSTNVGSAVTLLEIALCSRGAEFV